MANKTALYNANPSTNNNVHTMCVFENHDTFEAQRPDKYPGETARIITSLTARTRLAFQLAAYLKRKTEETQRWGQRGDRKQRSRKCRINMQWSLGRASRAWFDSRNKVYARALSGSKRAFYINFPG